MRTTEFAMIPTEEELRQTARELRFFPVDNATPQALSQEQVKSFNEKGYIKPLPVLSAEEIAAVRERFDRLLEGVLARGGDSYSISSAHLKYGHAYDLLTKPTVVSYMKDLLGPNVIGWGCHFFCKLPHDGKRVAWHQDASYWPLTPTKTATLWLAIDDADVENACMRFIPGSHLAGHIAYERSGQTEGNVLDQTVAGVERFGEPVDVELKAGEASIHSDLLLHGSEANDSDRRRCGLTLRYCAAEVYAYLDWEHKGVVVAGEDPTGRWVNPPRPAD